MKQIKLLVAGETPSLLSADKGNEVLSVLNSLLAATISPEGYGKFVWGDKNLKLDLTDLQKIVNQLNTNIAAISTVTVSGGGGGGGGSNSAVVNKINQIITALDGISIDAECDPVTRDITVTLNIDVPDPL